MAVNVLNVSGVAGSDVRELGVNCSTIAGMGKPDFAGMGVFLFWIFSNLLGKKKAIENRHGIGMVFLSYHVKFSCQAT
jgi:hypothetical protein